MCLKEVTKVLIPSNKPIVAWKVFDTYKEELYGLYNYIWHSTTTGRSQHIKIARWYRATNGRINLSREESYERGFHCFKTRAGARELNRKVYYKRCAIRKVRIRQVHILGIDGNHPCYVAKEMFVLPVKKRSKKA